MALTPELYSALSAHNPVVFLCGEANLPEYDLRLVDGAAKIKWGGNTFLGRDPIYGVLNSVDPPEDGFGDDAPTLSVTFSPPTDSAAIDLAQPSMQGSRIRIWIGVVDRATGAVVPGPYLIFDGELDQPSLTSGTQILQLDYDCVSVFDLFFDFDEGMRLSDSFHQSIWPGELGMSNVTGIVKTVIWGPGERTSGVITGGTSMSNDYA